MPTVQPRGRAQQAEPDDATDARPWTAPPGAHSWEQVAEAIQNAPDEREARSLLEAFPKASPTAQQAHQTQHQQGLAGLGNATICIGQKVVSKAPIHETCNGIRDVHQQTPRTTPQISHLQRNPLAKPPGRSISAAVGAQRH